MLPEPGVSQEGLPTSRLEELGVSPDSGVLLNVPR